MESIKHNKVMNITTKKISRLTDMENKLVVNNAEGGNLGVGD